MPDYTLEGRIGILATEDAGASKVYCEASTELVEAHVEGIGAPYVLVTADQGKVMTNEGAGALVAFTLPAAAAGWRFEFIVQDADGIRITAAAGDTIRSGNRVSPAAGYIESTSIGARLCLVAINATEWIARPTAYDWQVSQ